MNKKFTDNQLAHFYLSLYREYQREHYNSTDKIDVIYSKMLNSVNYTLQSTKGSRLSNLDAEEQKKVYGVLNAFIRSTAKFRYANLRNRPDFAHQLPETKVERGDSKLRFYCYSDGFNDIFYWSKLNDFLNVGKIKTKYDITNDMLDRTNNDERNQLGLMIMMAVALVGISFYYMVSQTINSTERFMWNEGWQQAAITLSSLVVGYVFGAAISCFFLMAIGMSNPLTIPILTMITVAILTAAATCYITNKFQNHCIQNANDEALDPQDPHRFKLTDKEEQHLIEIGLDPVSVKCALVALRQQMGEQATPSFLNRNFTSKGKRMQCFLDQVRELRSGELTTITVNSLHGSQRFDLECPVEKPDFERDAANDKKVTGEPEFDVIRYSP